MKKYLPTTATSRSLEAEERSFDGVVYQSNRPVLDSELNLAQDIESARSRVLRLAERPSGFLSGGPRRDLGFDFHFPSVSDPAFEPNSFLMTKQSAIVAGFPVVIEYTGVDIPGLNRINLLEPPVLGGTPPVVKRTDFVFLEVWRSLVSPAISASVRIEIQGPIVDGDEIEIGSVTFTARNTPTVALEFGIGTPSFTAGSLQQAINADGTHSATVSGSVLKVTSGIPGTAGNSLFVDTSGTADPGAFVLNVNDPSPASFSGGVDSTGTPGDGFLYRHGNTQSSLTVALGDDIVDPGVGFETTQRIQIQYRIRVTGTDEGINFKTQPDGFSNPNVLARGSGTTPVTGYRFVPADGSSTAGNTSASEYGRVDSGLWVAGDGSEQSASDLGTVDGFVYAIPIGFVFRRNDAYENGFGSGFDPKNNTNGGLTHDHADFTGNALIGFVPAGVSDRPDGLFADVVSDVDLLDLRRHVYSGDSQSELKYQIQALLDGTVKTWAIDTADKQQMGSGSGGVSTQPLICNEIGRESSKGGNDVTSGDSQHGVTVRSFDHIARRFGSQPVVERVVFAVSPDDTDPSKGIYVNKLDPGFDGWSEGDTIVVDFNALNASSLADWGNPSLAVNSSPVDFWPTGTKITDILKVEHDDGSTASPVDRGVEISNVIGIGSDLIEIELDENPTVADGGVSGGTPYVLVSDGGADIGSPRRIFVEVEITYPLGSGLTDTPDLEVDADPAVYPFGPAVENDPTQRSPEMISPTPPGYREGYREVRLEQISGDALGGPVSDQVVSLDENTLILPRRIAEGNLSSLSVIDTNDGIPRPVSFCTEFASSSRKLVLDSPLSSDQALCDVTYVAQDPIPNYGGPGGGYQVSVYYRTNAPQTTGTKEGLLDTETGGGPLPTVLNLRPIASGTQVYTCQTGKGSVDLPFPYSSPMDQLPVNAESLDTGGGYTSCPPYSPGPYYSPSVVPFQGDWEFAAGASISTSNFDADTGMLTLSPMVDLDSGGVLTLGSDVEPPIRDAEFRAYYSTAESRGYLPTAISQPLSAPVSHKSWFPVLAVSEQDTRLFRKGEVVLVVFTRYSVMDSENSVRFQADSNRTAAAVYRTKNLLLMRGADDAS